MRALAFILLLLSCLAPCSAKTCLILYQLADNNLEYYIRQDYEEMSVSPVIRDTTNLRTWVYYDALNQGGAALPNTVDENGNTVGPFTGGRYITYNANAGRLQVAQTLPGEPNSDLQSTVQSFLRHAMSDCVNNGFMSFMVVFGSHAGGFAGFGGDENKRRNLGLAHSHRKLLQTNQQIASSIRQALDSTSGAPSKLDVLGFDACNMQAFEAADDYGGVAHHLLASEGLEPGHGWSYTNLNTATSALDLAKQVVSEFLARTQGGRFHQVPKTLAILDLAKFQSFLTNFETFSGEMLPAMQGGDVSLHSFLARARSSAVTFEGILDTQGARNPSSVDIGSFLNKLQQLCNPGGNIQAALENSINSYTSMFVVTGVGPGTAAGTGMHMVWPTQGEYLANKQLFDTILFQSPNYVTAVAPKFRSFLSWFLNAAVPGGGSLDNSICSQHTQPPAALNADPNALIVQDKTTLNAEAATFHVETVIGTKVSQMVVEYSIDLSTALKPLLIEKGYTPEEDEYLLLKGGDVTGAYRGATFESTWDQNFYFLNITGQGTFEALYVVDSGNQKRIPVMYFPEENRTQVAELQFLDYLFFDFQYWQENGARYSYLMFSTDEAEGRINQNLALFISNGDNGYAEQPREAGGLLMPLVYIDAYIQDNKLDTLPGGFNQTIIEWKPDLDYNILTTTAALIFDVIPETDAVTMNLYAVDGSDPDREPDVRYYDVIRRTRVSEEPLFTSSPQMASMAPVEGIDSEATDGAVVDGTSSEGSSAGLRIADSSMRLHLLAVLGGFLAMLC